MDMIWTMKVHVSVSNTYPFFYKLLKNVENIAERECDNHGTQNVEEDGENYMVLLITIIYMVCMLKTN